MRSHTRPDPDADSQPTPVATVDRMLATLSHATKAMLHGRRDKAGLLNQICRILCDELGFDAAWVSEVRPADERPLTLQACCVHPDAAQRLTAEALALKVSPLAAETLAAGRIFRREGGFVDGDQAAPQTVMVFPAALGSAHPLALGVASCDQRRPMEIEAGLLQDLAGDLAVALDALETETRTRQAEEALRVSEDRFRRLAEHSLVGIVLIQNDLYRYVNPAFATMFGYDSPRDIIDRLGPLDLAALESHDIVAENVEKRVLGQLRASRYQYRGVRRDGRIIDVEEHGARTVHAGRLAIVATVLDITSREASRRRLEALSTAGLTLAAAQTPQQALDKAVEQVARLLPCDAAALLLLDSASPRLAAHAQAPAAGTLVARTGAAELLAALDAIADDASADDASADGLITTTHRLATALGRPTLGEARAIIAEPLIVRGEKIGALVAEAARPEQFTPEDGRHLRIFADHVAATLQHLRLIATLEDERSRLKTLNALSHALSETLDLHEAGLRALEQTRSAFRADHGLLMLWDGAAETLSPLVTDGIARETAHTALAHHRLAIRDHVRTCATDRPPRVAPLDAPWTWIRDGSPTTRAVLEIPLRAHGELIGLMLLLSDEASAFEHVDLALATTLNVPVALALQNARFYERAAGQARAMAEALRRQEELDRMKDELIQNISHELRTPLALVMGYAEMLAAGELGPVREEQAVAVDVIARRSRMLRSLVEDIALLWHLEQRQEEQGLLDLAEIVATSAADFRSEARTRGLRIEASRPDVQVPVQGEPLQIRRVLDNIIGNALKFTPQGGTIDVRLTTDERWARLSVCDTGIGVPQAQLSRIFERFYQVDGSSRRAYGGTGLGLALVKAIIEAHGGDVVAESPATDDADHPGTCITIHLPLAS